MHFILSSSLRLSNNFFSGFILLASFFFVHHLPTNTRMISRQHGMPLTFKQMADELLALITANQKDSTANEAAFEKIQTVLKQLKQQFYLAEKSHNKKQNALQILQNASEILSHLYFLKNGTVRGYLLSKFVDRTLKALKQTTSLSHDQYVGPEEARENRKLQVLFCFVESLTELLVHDIDTFGLDIGAYEKCGRMRREIANALMNVVYQQREAKLRLCSNLAFLRRVADIVANVPSLDQYYAGLVQNVSYNFDRKSLHPFAHHLSITVSPMVRGVILIMGGHEGQRNSTQSWAEPKQKQRLYKFFSALWNLAENPIENKRRMCLDYPAFVPILLRIMVEDPLEVPLIQAAIGIFKQLSTFIIQYPELFSKTLASGAIRALLHQIYSSSSELIIDALIALSTLCRHPYAAYELLCQKNCLENIRCLTKNTNEDIVREARSLIDTVNSVYYQVVALQNGMFSSVVGWNCASTSVEANHQIADVGVANKAMHYNTLPRAAQQSFFKTQKGQNATKNLSETPKGVFRQQNFHQQLEQNVMAPTQFVQRTTKEETREHLGLHGQSEKEGGETSNEATTAEEGAFVTEPLIEAGQDIATSVQCTRDGSPQSLRSMDEIADQNGDEWPSVRSTSCNSRLSSGTGSPASPSDLPDSPSQCVAHKPFQLEAMALLIKKALEEEDETTDGNGKGQMEGSWTQIGTDQNGGGGNAIVVQRTSGANGRQGEKWTSGNTLTDEGENANGSINDAFLDEVIRNYMPKPNAPVQCFTAESTHFTLNTTPISSKSSSKSPVRSKERGAETRDHKNGNGRLLEESIALMMPHPNRKSSGKAYENPKKEKTFERKIDDQQKHSHLTLEEDETETFPEQQQKVTAELPADVNAELDAHWMVVECGTAKSSITDDDERNRYSLKKTHSQTSIPRPSVALSDCSPKTTTIISADLDENCANSLLKRPATRSSIRTQKALPPPLAPKPNIAKLKKLPKVCQ